MWINLCQLLLPECHLGVRPGTPTYWSKSYFLELQPHFYYPQLEVERPGVLEVPVGQGGEDGAGECLETPSVG